jgi:hypothetical protein
MDPIARAAVTDALPGATVSSVETPATGNTKRTAFVTLVDGRDLVVQSRLAGTGLATEAALARAVARRTDVPVPRVLATGTVDGTEYVLVERVPGEDLHTRFVDLDPETRETVVRSMGRWLAALHDAFAFDGYGPVRTDDEDRLVVADPATDWRAWFRDYAWRALDRVEDGFGGEPDGDGVAALVSRIRAAVEADVESLPADPPAHLFPWDLRPGNATVAEDRVTALLDWGDPLAAARGLSLAKATYVTVDWYLPDPSATDALRAAFLDGYRERLALPPLSDAERRLYRLAAISASAVDSRGRVTRPRFPELEDGAAVAFHRRQLAAALDGETRV